MNASLPFRHNEEKTFLSKVHPVLRLFLPFFFVIPFLLIDNIYLIFTFLIFTLIFCIISRLKLLRILSRIKAILPFILLITIFIPLYIGETVVYEIDLGIKIFVYQEGLARAFLLFMRIFGAAFIFMSFYSAFTYSEFVEAITTLKLPSFFVGSFIIMLHYIPIIASSNRIIVEAQELRGKKMTNYWQKLKAHAFIMGKSLVMNMERSEKIYESLKMRGFTGKMTFAHRKIKFIDLGIILIFLLISISFSFFIELEPIYQRILSICML